MLTGLGGRTRLRSARVAHGTHGKSARRPRRLAWALALAVALAALFLLSLSQSLDHRAELRRGVEHPPGAGDAAREPAAARLVDLGRLLLHDRAARVRAGGGGPGSVARRGAHLRRAHLHAHGGAGGAARPGTRDRPGRAAPGRDRGRRSCSRRPSSAAPRSSSRTPTTSAPRCPSCSCCCCWTGGRGATTSPRRAGTSRSRSAALLAWTQVGDELSLVAATVPIAAVCGFRLAVDRRPSSPPDRAPLGRAAAGRRAGLGSPGRARRAGPAGGRRLRPAADRRHPARLARAAPCPRGRPLAVAGADLRRQQPGSAEVGRSRSRTTSRSCSAPICT